MQRNILDETRRFAPTFEIDLTNIGGGIYGSESAWRVYGRENLPLYFLQHSYSSLKQAGSSTYFCSRCQPKRTQSVSPPQQANRLPCTSGLDTSVIKAHYSVNIRGELVRLATTLNKLLNS